MPESAANGLPKRIRRLREARGWTVAALARMVGVAPAVIANAEAGRNDPMARTVAALARVFEITMDDVWYGSDRAADAERRAALANESVARTFGERVRAFRLARGWSQRDLAEQIGATQQAVQRCEGGMRAPNLTTFVNLADALGVGLDVLWRGRAREAPDAEQFERRALEAEDTLAAIQKALTGHKARHSRRLRSRPRIVGEDQSA